MVLWSAWYRAVQNLRPACHRTRTYLWLVLALMGMCCRMDLAGVTSFVRVLRLKPRAYPRFLGLFHSKGLDLDLLTHGWIRLALRPVHPIRSRRPHRAHCGWHQGRQGRAEDAGSQVAPPGIRQ